MRRYDIVSRILLILSIIDFAVAAPVLVQEKRQACVDVLDISRDVINVLGKRGPGEEDLDKLANLAKEHLETGEKPVESSDAHAPSSSAPPGPDPGSTNVVPAPAPNPAPSTANPVPLMESSSPSSTFSSDSEDDVWLLQLHDELIDSDWPQRNPNKSPLTGPDSDFDWDHWTKLANPPPLRPAKVPKLEEPGQADEYQVEHVQQPNPNPTNVLPAPAPNLAPSTANPTSLTESPTASSDSDSDSSSDPDWDSSSDPETDSNTKLLLQLHEMMGAPPPLPKPNKRPLTGPDPDFDWDYWTNLKDSPPPRPIPKVPKFEEWGQAKDRPKVEHVQQPNPNKRPLTGPDPDFDWDYWMNMEGPPPRPAKVPKLGESDQANEYQVVHVQQPDRGPSTLAGSGFDGNDRPQAGAVPVEYRPSTSAGLPVFHAPPPSPESADPGLPSDHQSSSTDSEPVDLIAAAAYAAKGKAKVPRRISGTTRDVGNAARR